MGHFPENERAQIEEGRPADAHGFIETRATAPIQLDRIALPDHPVSRAAGAGADSTQRPNISADGRRIGFYALRICHHYSLSLASNAGATMGNKPPPVRNNRRTKSKERGNAGREP